jgi:hypothetical protein
MSGSLNDRPSGAFTLLLLLAAFAFAAGCSNANTSGGVDGSAMNHVDPSGQSVPGWLVLPAGGAHAPSAVRNYIANGDSSACAECHGADLSGGISRVSCFGNVAGCHHGAATGWVAASPAVQATRGSPPARSAMEGIIPAAGRRRRAPNAIRGGRRTRQPPGSARRTRTPIRTRRTSRSAPSATPPGRRTTRRASRPIPRRRGRRPDASTAPCATVRPSPHTRRRTTTAPTTA